MAQCLVTTLSEAVDNPNIVAPDELVIKINHVSSSFPSSARRMQFLFRAASTVRMADTSYHFANENGDDLGSTVTFTANTAQNLYFPNPDAGKSYKVIVSNKYALAGLNTQEFPTTQYNFFEFDLEDLRHCTYLNALRCMCHKITGKIEDLDRVVNIEYVQIGRTGVSGDIASLKKHPYLRYFKATPSDIYGDIAVVKDLPLLRNFEVGSCLEVYGNLSAFANHTSINYVSFPQMASHPAIEGDIANLANCTSLGYLSATNEAKIYGNISALSGLSSLYSVYLSGTSVSGNIGSLAGMTSLQNIGLGNSMSDTYIGPSDTKVVGDIASLSGLPLLRLVSMSYTGVTGDVGNLVNVPRLAEVYLTNTGITGEIGDFSAEAMPNLKILDVGNCTGIEGDIAEFTGHDTLESLQIYGTNVTGDIGEALEDCTTLTAVGFTNTDVSGDVTKIYKDTSIQTGTASGCPYVEGDLSELPAAFYYFQSNGRDGATFSWSANNARSSSSTIIAFDNVDFGDDVEKMLINQASCTAKSNSATWLYTRIYVWGDNVTADTLSASCKTACATLAEKGYQVYVNGVLVADPE